GFYAGYIAGRAIAMQNANTAFDVWDSGQRSEVPLGYVLDKLVSFTDAIYALRIVGRHARNFPPYFALASLHDPSSEIVDSFLGLWKSKRAEGLLLKSERAVMDPNDGLRTLWATAVAALYGDSNALTELKQGLDDTYLHLAS